MAELEVRRADGAGQSGQGGEDSRIDALGRAAGAALRHAPPPGALDVALRRGRHQRAVRAGVAAGGALAVLAAVVVAMSVVRSGDGRSPVATTPDTQVPVTGTADEIVFTTGAEGGDDFALNTVAADGRDTRLVRRTIGTVTPSPDGRMLLTTGTTSEGRIAPLLVKPDGSGDRLLSGADPTLGLGVPGWSPDGTRLAVEGFDENDRTRNGVYTMSSAGDDLVRLTSPGLRHDWLPDGRTYSPDGRHLMFMRSVAPVDSDDAAMNLLVVGPDGTGLVQLNPSGTTTARFALGGTADWSPDGSHVAFIAAEGDYWSATPRRAVFVAASDGSDAVRITEWSDPLTVDWSPDGALLALSGGDPWQISTVRPDGSDLRVVTNFDEGYRSQNAVWSPDSARLLFMRTKGGSAQSLWVADADGSNLVQVADTTMDLFSGYVWMPR